MQNYGDILENAKTTMANNVDDFDGLHTYEEILEIRKDVENLSLEDRVKRLEIWLEKTHRYIYILNSCISVLNINCDYVQEQLDKINGEE